LERTDCRCALGERGCTARMGGACFTIGASPFAGGSGRTVTGPGEPADGGASTGRRATRCCCVGAVGRCSGGDWAEAGAGRTVGASLRGTGRTVGVSLGGTAAAFRWTVRCIGDVVRLPGSGFPAERTLAETGEGPAGRVA
jgi:hypothetical protein